jgi:hypothetical protein
MLKKSVGLPLEYHVKNHKTEHVPTEESPQSTLQNGYGISAHLILHWSALRNKQWLGTNVVSTVMGITRTHVLARKRNGSSAPSSGILYAKKKVTCTTESTHHRHHHQVKNKK